MTLKGEWHQLAFGTDHHHGQGGLAVAKPKDKRRARDRSKRHWPRVAHAQAATTTRDETDVR